MIIGVVGFKSYCIFSWGFRIRFREYISIYFEVGSRVILVDLWERKMNFCYCELLRVGVVCL